MKPSWHRWAADVDPRQIQAADCWMWFLDPQGENMPLHARRYGRANAIATSVAVNVRARGLPWIVDALASKGAFAWSVCQHAEIADALSIVNRRFKLRDHRMIADALLDAGHAWLGEPLQIWCMGTKRDRTLAVRLLIERVPYLPEFDEWLSSTPSVHTLADGSSLTVSLHGGTETVTFTFAEGSTTADVINKINASAYGITASQSGDTILLNLGNSSARSRVEWGHALAA